jgi:urease accessory protein
MPEGALLRWLQLLQLADSAIPIGGTAHSFGIEMLVADGVLRTQRDLAGFFADYLDEVGTFEAAYCSAAYRLYIHRTDISVTVDTVQAAWCALNLRLDALRTSREARQASTTLGRRFLQLVNQVTANAEIATLVDAAKQAQAGIHHCTAFGVVGAMLELPLQMVVSAYLHQTLAAQISACQRLLPLGQSGASQLQWELKPRLAAVAVRGAMADHLTIPLCTPMLDLASQRHLTLTTRLFIS